MPAEDDLPEPPESRCQRCGDDFSERDDELFHDLAYDSPRCSECLDEDERFAIDRKFVDNVRVANNLDQELPGDVIEREEELSSRYANDPRWESAPTVADRTYEALHEGDSAP